MGSSHSAKRVAATIFALVFALAVQGCVAIVPGQGIDPVGEPVGEWVSVDGAGATVSVGADGELSVVDLPANVLAPAGTTGVDYSSLVSADGTWTPHSEQRGGYDSFDITLSASPGFPGALSAFQYREGNGGVLFFFLSENSDPSSYEFRRE